MSNIIQVEFLVEFVAIIGALVTGGAYLKKLQKKINEPVLKELKNLKEQQSKMYLEILKLTITDTEINPQERIRAFDRYTKAGGNGTIKTYVEKKLKPKLEKEYNNVK